MEKKRMQKLAGINEGTFFKNGKFKLNRCSANREGDMYFDEDGEYCYADEVAKLEELASEMLEVVQMTIASSAPNNLGGIAKAARAVIKKAKSL